MNRQFVHVVDDDEGIRVGLNLLLETIDQPCKLYSNAQDFLDSYDPEHSGCLVLDIRMPKMTGLDLQKVLNEKCIKLPIIFITGHGDIPMAVEAMRQGALDFIRKPFREQDLLDSIGQALEIDAGKREAALSHKAIIEKLALLTLREEEVFERVSRGDMNKTIAHDLNISERTVEVHRSQVMNKLDVRSLAQLVRIKIESELITLP